MIKSTKALNSKYPQLIQLHFSVVSTVYCVESYQASLFSKNLYILASLDNIRSSSTYLLFMF